MRASPLVATLRARRPRRHRVESPDAPGGGAREAVRAGADARAAPPVLRILVVDDDPLMRDLLPRKLARAIASPAADILTATTPEEGVTLARDMRPDVVISDFNLRSTRDGLDVLEEIRRVHPDAVRILFSAHTPEEVGPRLGAADIHGFVEKTLRLDDLLDPLFAVIRQAKGIPLERAPPGSR